MPSETIKKYQEKIEFYELVLDNIRNGVMITEPDGKIIFFSSTYGNFIGIDHKSTIGKNCADVVENTRMPTVAQ
ncbi:MAG: PAS domain-containing protein, partial [Proteobacteria bacterium]|nr:PAS domain-containing protein [Pseudomonadota bacterium]